MATRSLTKLRLAIVSSLVLGTVTCRGTADELPLPPPIGNGWFWYERKEPEPVIEPEGLQEQRSTSSAQPESTPATTDTVNDGGGGGGKVRIDHAWLKEQIPRLQEQAFNNPTDTNLAAYWGAMRLTMDMSTRFANRSREWFSAYPELSEDRRRPNVAAALHARQDETLARQLDVLTTVWESGSGLWFFYRSDCPYCHKQLPILEILKQSRGIDIIGISMDGLPLSDNSPIPWVADQVSGQDGMTAAQRLGVTMTPSIILVTPDWQFRPVATGLSSGPEITAAIIKQAHKLNLVTDEDLMLANEIYDINTVGNGATIDGIMEVDAERLRSDPGYLNQVVLDQVRQYGTIDGTPVTNQPVQQGQ